MRDLKQLDRWRNVEHEMRAYGHMGGSKFGVFAIPSPVDRLALNVIASSGAGWEHVSVSRGDRTPTWREMEAIRRHFYKEDETVAQIHPPINEYVDGGWPGGNSRFTLHLWRPTNVEMPRPPRWMVGANDRADSDLMHAEADKYFEEHPEEDQR